MDVLSEFTWTNDCQGKQDFDGEIVTLSTRYWPSGGGFSVFDGGSWEENDARPHIKPSAHSTIYMLGKALCDRHFEADTEAEVKAAVEAWARTQIERVEILLSPLRSLADEAAKGGE